LLDVVKMEVTRLLMTVRIQSQEQVAQAAEEIEARASQVGNVTYTHPNEDGSVSSEAGAAGAAAAAVASMPKVGRNELCPCGSGKKYKNCHGKLA
jgi:preprotein translocase subunit SecA